MCTDYSVAQSHTYTSILPDNPVVSGLSINTESNLEIVNNLSFSLRPGAKLAIIGSEGVGKSSILKVLAGESLAGMRVSGVVSMINAAYLPQSIAEADTKLSVLDYLLRSNLQEEMLPEDWLRYDEAKRTLLRCKLSPSVIDEERTLSTYSGGEVIRIMMARLMLLDPECYLLDEPSNHLDLATIVWLEEFIKTTPKTVIFVSHDETLLENCAEQIIYLHHVWFKNKTEIVVSGERYTDFISNRDLQIRYSEQAAENKAREIRALEQKYLALRSKCSAKQPRGDDAAMMARALRGAAGNQQHTAQLKEKLARIEKPEVIQREEAMRLDFLQGNPVDTQRIMTEIHLEQLTQDRTVLAREVKLSVSGRERVVITGKNGVGKTTLIRQVLKDAAQRPGVVVGYLPQDYAELLAGAQQKTVVSYLLEVRDDSTFIRTILSRLGFEREAASLCISALSGGQKSKLLLARLILQGCNFLVLDEPTSNLSPLSSPVLRSALRSFPGAILAISHDRKFIKEVATRVLKLTESGLETL